MHAHNKKLVALMITFLIAAVGCSSETTTNAPTTQGADTSATQQTVPEQTPDSDADDDTDADAGGETTIPAGAYAASADFAFPIPEGWQVLDEFTADTLGADPAMYASVEYPGDAKEAAATYLSVLTDAGFDATTYGPGELTNQASLVANGVVNGIHYVTLLNFDVHADGYQRVSIIATEDD